MLSLIFVMNGLLAVEKTKSGISATLSLVHVKSRHGLGSYTSKAVCALRCANRPHLISISVVTKTPQKIVGASPRIVALRWGRGRGQATWLIDAFIVRTKGATPSLQAGSFGEGDLKHHIIRLEAVRIDWIGHGITWVQV